MNLFQQFVKLNNISWIPKETYFIFYTPIYSFSPLCPSLSRTIEDVDFRPTYTPWNTHERQIKILPRTRLHTWNPANDRPGPSLITHSPRTRSPFSPRFARCREIFPSSKNQTQEQSQKIGAVYGKVGDGHAGATKWEERKGGAKRNKK